MCTENVAAQSALLSVLARFNRHQTYLALSFAIFMFNAHGSCQQIPIKMSRQ